MSYSGYRHSPGRHTRETKRGNMAKVHKSIRLEAEQIERINSQRGDGETQAAAIARLLSEALDAAERAHSEHTKESTASTQEHTAIYTEIYPEEHTRAHKTGDASTQESTHEHTAEHTLKEHIETLQAANRTLTEQLEAKDRQIESLTKLADHAQQLAAIAQAANAPKLDAPQEAQAAPEEAKRGFGARIREFFTL